MLRTTGFGAHISTIRPGHRELAADRRARFVNAAIHLRIVQRHAPTVGVARHHRHTLFVALGQVRRNGVFLEQHHGQAAAQGIAAAAMHSFFAGDRVQEVTAMVPLAAKMNGKAGIAGMVAPGGRRPGGVRTQERERSEPDGDCGPRRRGAVWNSGRNARMQRFLRPSYRMRAKPARAGLRRSGSRVRCGRPWP